MVFALTLAIFMLAACGGQAHTVSAIYEAEYIMEQLEAADADDADIGEAGQGLFAVDDNPFAVILGAYAELELSNFAVYGADLTGHSLHARSGMIPFGNRSDEWQLMYAIHDISGQPTLFIGAQRRESSLSADNFITGVYSLQNGEPVSAIQLGNRRHSVRLFTDISGNYVITHGHGHMSHAWEYFYALEENGVLTAQDRLYTRGHRVRRDESRDHDYIYAFYRYRYVDGEEVSITEEEYTELIRKYGSWGYGVLDLTEDDARAVNLEWRPVVSANQ